ncbi:SpoIIE family protein phosphatase [Actinophytocola oryzae]|uniref:Stage II sporulation protein E n=1 Tax=Actinophytocola oryzae TaxID=502181 RepID=A0A4R7VCT2_9PSEU|nr:SpoIIE family protein phosphatase [Actinophytocola oryzae]TDV46914.1 stage II sporulation protein E [Actinophytocola oryzae]
MTPRIEVAERAGVGLDGAIRPSEDVVVVLPNAVVLLDGATSLDPSLPSGGWYASRLAGELAGRLAGYPDTDLADLLAGAIKSVARDNGLVPGRSPSSTVALLRWTDTVVEGLVLADSPIVAFTREGPSLLADTRIERLPRGSGYRDQLRSGGGYGERHVIALRQAGQTTARRRNVEGGFWVAEADPDAAHQAERTTWPRDTVTTVLMATDGVTCGIDPYGVFADWQALRDLATTSGPESVLDQVRAAELDDPAGTRWPRPKPHDDQALVVIDYSVDYTGEDR